MPVKLRLEGPSWLALQHTLYPYFALVGAPIETLAILAAGVLTYLERTGMFSQTRLLRVAY